MKKKILITAGATTVPIDKVRSITNIFKGRTGYEIAMRFAVEGHDVTLMTSNKAHNTKWTTNINYVTYDDLLNSMEAMIKDGDFDVIIHSAAVSDYKVAGVLVPGYDPEVDGLIEIDNTKKISSSYEEIYLKMTPTLKIIDLIRGSWGFKGTLIKFKLQVGIGAEELIEIAKKSRIDSKADIIVANCLEWSKESAYVISENKHLFVDRKHLGHVLVSMTGGDSKGRPTWQSITSF